MAHKISHFALANGGYVTIVTQSNGTYGYAFCSPEDEFSEDAGVVIALNRIGLTTEVVNDFPMEIRAMQDMLYWGEYPQSAKAAFYRLVGTCLIYYSEGEGIGLTKPKFFS